MRVWKRKALPLLAALAFSVSAAAPAAAANTDGISVVKSDKLGEYIADSDGRPLYMFTTDKQGAGYATPSSSCAGDCAKAWPPFIAQSSPKPGDGIKPELIGVMDAGGTKQVTYNGWPLYFFIKDEGQDAPQGQDKHGFGGEWYLVTPSGEKVHEEGHEE